MNLRELPGEGTALHALGANRTLALELPAGATVRALTGTVWMTEEGFPEDVVLASGARVTTRARGLVVMNAVDETATVYVELPQEENQPRYVLTPALIAAVEANARRLRQKEFVRLADLVLGKLAAFAKAHWSSFRRRRTASIA